MSFIFGMGLKAIRIKEQVDSTAEALCDLVSHQIQSSQRKASMFYYSI